MLTPKYLTSRAVTSPVRPSVARKAKASGTPAKFEATPQNVIKVGRTHRCRPPIIPAYAKKKPIKALTAKEMSAKPQSSCALLHIRTDDGIPLLSDDLLRRPLLVQRREHGLFICSSRWQFSQEFCRHLALLHQFVEPDRMTVAR